MKARSQRVTVALEEAVVKWLRREATRQKSLPGVATQIINDHVRSQSIDEDSYNRAMKRALARKPFLKTNGKYPSREEIYDRARHR